MSIPSAFKLVYQGGHHNVYCDGNTHIKTSGGYTGLTNPPKERSRFKCDCARWAAFNSLIEHSALKD